MVYIQLNLLIYWISEQDVLHISLLAKDISSCMGMRFIVN